MRTPLLLGVMLVLAACATPASTPTPAPPTAARTATTAPTSAAIRLAHRDQQKLARQRLARPNHRRRTRHQPHLPPKRR